MPSNRNAERISRFVNCEEYNAGNMLLQMVPRGLRVNGNPECHQKMTALVQAGDAGALDKAGSSDTEETS